MAIPPQSSVPLSKVELSFSCSKLKNLDITSKSDPQIYIFLQPPRTTTWTEIGKTEMIQDNLNPKFAQSVIVDYYFEEVQNMRFVVVDVDKPARGWQEQDFIGDLEITLGGIVGSKGSQVTKELHDKHKKVTGFITVSAEEVQEMRMVANAHGLEKKDFFGKSDPFLTISKIRIEDSQWVKVHQTEYILKTLDPVWKPFQIPMTKLCNGDMDRPLLIECFDWNKSGSFELIGQVQTCVRELQSKKGHTLDLVDPKKKGKKGYTNSGTLRIDDLDLIKEHSFLDYIVGGCKISLMVAIDFTRNPRTSNSLHHINPYSPNEYEKAIMAVGNILACYDSDNMFPVYGFGAKIPPSWQVSHCFALNGNPSNPEVFGVQGILDAYHKAIIETELYGPTNFQPIINMASLIAAPHQSQQDQQYLILLIITDGEITDMDQTVAEIVNDSKLPIVGVGGADFTKMNILDADNQALSSGGKTAERDIVQFVPFRDYTNVHYSKLAADTLAEVPGQLIGWMKRRNIVPNPPLQYAPPPQPVANQNPVSIL